MDDGDHRGYAAVSQEAFMHCTRSVAVLAVLVAALGCDLLDPNRPTSYPDTNVFGNLLEVSEPAPDTGVVTVTVRVGVPRLLADSEEQVGKPTPTVEDALVAEIAVSADTLVLFNGEAATLAALAPGREIAALPVPGTTRMVGSDRVLVDASHLMDFDTYRRWQLPRLATAEETAPSGDPARVNSSGVERSPVPAADGRVLYFAARWRAPALPGGSWHGVARDGLPAPDPDAAPAERTFRTEMGDDGWSVPELVTFPGIDGAVSQRVTWMAPDESLCLVSVRAADGTSWIGRVERSGETWSEPERLTELGDGVADGVFLAGSRTKITFATARGGQSDLWLHDPKVEGSPLPREPRLNTAAEEVAPRTGPAGELYFTRDGRQLVLAGSSLLRVEVEGQHRALVSEANPTADGQWMFVTVPRFRPVEPDLDIRVAKVLADGRLGPPVAVDDWRP
jgi:hypothetical protein